jgi:tripartite-type tricarboxylate transporter receptor subunit TctC
MVTDLLGGQLRVGISGLSPSIGHIKAGKLRAVAVGPAARSAILPDVPTIGETVPRYEASGWSGIVAPKGTPPGIVDTLYRAIVAAQADPGFQARLTDLGVTVLALSPAAFGKFIADETEKWGKVVKFAGLKPQ